MRREDRNRKKKRKTDKEATREEEIEVGGGEKIGKEEDSGRGKRRDGK